MQELRGTGRTTRMLDEAKRLAREGMAVYVIAATRAHVRLFERMAGDSGIKFETPDSPGNFDWQTMRLVGSHPNCVVLVDHYAIELHFAPVLEMLHRFDQQAG